MIANTTDARLWDRAARKYASKPIEDVAGYERTLDRIGHLISRSDTVLEIGCGTGGTALRLATVVSRVVATDFSGEMIAIAREKSNAEDAVRNVDFSVAKAECAPARDGGYDAVLALNLLHLVPDRPSALAQIQRLLKPGGLFISKTPCLAEMNAIVRVLVPCMRLTGLAPHVSFFSAGQLEEEIAGVGFEIVERARHGSKPKEPRIFIAARKSDLVRPSR